MYVLCLTNTKLSHPEQSEVVTTIRVSDDPEKIEIALKMLSSLVRLVPHERVKGIIDAMTDLTAHYRVHVHLQAEKSGKRPIPPLLNDLPEAARMRFMLDAVDQFVSVSAEEFICWLRIAAKKPMPGGLLSVV